MGSDPVGSIGVDVAAGGVNCRHVANEFDDLTRLIRVGADKGFLVGCSVPNVADELHMVSKLLRLRPG